MSSMLASLLIVFSVNSGTLPARAAPSTDLPDVGRLGLQDHAERATSRVLSQHVLMTGNPTHLEREWTCRRSALGQIA